MRLSDDRYEFIKNEVVHLFKIHQVNCIPVSGFELLSKMEIKLRSYSSLNQKALSAALKISSDGFYIDTGKEETVFYNDMERNYNRINMTLLHEAGHAALGHTGSEEKAAEEEAEAGFFAKYAAAPPPLIHRIKPKIPEDIMAFFGIGYDAATYALTYYNKWLCYGAPNLLPYEKELLQLFSTSA